jgi:hypothetical protein
VRLGDKETRQQVQALEPFTGVLDPSHKHQSTLLHPPEGQVPKGTEKEQNKRIQPKMSFT